MSNEQNSELIQQFLAQATPEERGTLLGVLVDQDIVAKNGFIPDGAWFPVQRAFALPYVEVAVTRQTVNPEILLVYREDQDWKGWHIPGGMWRANWSIELACQRTAKTELETEVKFLREVMTYKWPDHPYGNPISHVCLCESLTEVPQSDTRRYFSQVPDNTVPHHGDFVQACFDYLRSSPS